MLMGLRWIVKILRLVFRVMKGTHLCFYGLGIEKVCSLSSAMKASTSLCQASIEYWSIPTTCSLYLSTLVCCGFRDVASEKLAGLSFKATLIFSLTRFVVLKPFSKALSHDQNRVQRTRDQ